MAETLKIKLTQGQVALVDGELFWELNRYNWCAALIGKYYYARRSICATAHCKAFSIKMAQHVFELYGEPAPKKVVHLDENRLNNQRSNLRPATHTDIMRLNAKLGRSASGFIGVSWNLAMGKWFAYASKRGSTIDLGHYDDPVVAARIRDEYVAKHYGPFAVLNFGAAV